MATSATNIDDLPSGDNNTANSKPAQNVSFDIKENTVVNNQGGANIDNAQQSSTVQLSQDDVNKIISGIQQASQSKLTALPVRDVPTQQTHITMDEESHNPNFVPQQNKNDYIQNHSNYEAVLKQQHENQKQQNKQDELFDELQTPIMISLLFFIFQLPIFRKYMFMYLPNLFLKDGNISLGGIIFKALLFGIAYYTTTKMVDQFSTV